METQMLPAGQLARLRQQELLDEAEWVRMAGRPLQSQSVAAGNRRRDSIREAVGLALVRGGRWLLTSQPASRQASSRQ